MKKIYRILLTFYKRALSPFIGRNCKYTPTCSVYAYDALVHYGVIVGSVKGLIRVLKCNPFSKGGFEPISENYRGSAKWLV